MYVELLANHLNKVLGCLKAFSKVFIALQFHWELGACNIM